jgi:integrase
LNWLDRNGYPVNKEALQFDSNVPKSEKVITYLTLEELRHFASFPLKQQYLRNARDIFCFMCYTSLRYSDTAALKKSSISDGFIHVFTQKTKAKLDIPIIKDAQEILDNIMSTPGEYVFKAPSNQKLNDFIKLAAKEAKLDRKIQEMYYVGNEPHETYKPIHEIISCHMARRTFVVCSLALGIPVEVVKACTGHSTYEAMKPYIAIDSSTTKTYMEKWNVKTTRLQILKKIERLSSSQMMQLDNFLSTLLGDAPVNT